MASSFGHGFEGESMPIAARYTFYDVVIGRHDGITYEMGEYRTVRRVIEYAKPTREQQFVRNAIAEKGLLLGHEEPKLGSAETVSFIVPRGARPIAHDRPNRVTGRYQYDDRSMFLDLGNLLMQLSLVEPERTYQMTGSIGMNVAQLNFTRTNARRILLVPGFEHYVEVVSDNQEVLLGHYVNQLSNEFGLRFEHSIDDFAKGFEG